jgi:hypothetical protein
MTPQHKEQHQMRTTRTLILCLFAVFAFSAVASATASASNDEWEVCEKVGTEEFETHKCAKKGVGGKWSWKVLAAGEKRKVVSEGGTFTLTGGAVTITCNKVKDEGEITGGTAGTDLASTILFTECKTSKEKCLVKSAKGTRKGAPEGKGEIEVTNVPTELIQTETAGGVEVEADLFKGSKGTEKEFVTLELGEVEEVVGGVHTLKTKCGTSVPETTKVVGNVAAETVGSGELNFPEPPLVASTGTEGLKAFGVGVKLVGKDTQAVIQVAGETVAQGWAVRAS